MWGLWLNANLSSRTDLARDRAEELLAIGERSGQEDLILEAVHCRWSTANFHGDVAAAISAARDDVEHYDTARHSHLGAEFGGHDAGVCAHAIVGLACAQLGTPREAAASVERSLALARKLDQPSSVTFALMLALATYQVIGDRGATARSAVELSELAETFHMPPYRSIAAYFSAWAGACDDARDAGLRAMEAEFPRVSVMGPMPNYYAGMLAAVRLQAGHARRALELLDGVLRTVNEPGVGLYLPEIHRLRGRCLLRVGDSSFDAAVGEFEAAIHVAKQQRARVFQRLTAIDLAHAWSSVSRIEDGRTPLREAVGLFTDDDSPAQLATARRLLAGLPS